MGPLTRFLPTRSLTLLLSNLTLLGAHKLHWFLEIICKVRKYGDLGLCQICFLVGWA
jgi:hypothetical protein